jgi:hypothetical protein
MIPIPRGHAVACDFAIPIGQFWGIGTLSPYPLATSVGAEQKKEQDEIGSRHIAQNSFIAALLQVSKHSGLATGSVRYFLGTPSPDSRAFRNGQDDPARFSLPPGPVSLSGFIIACPH